MTHCADNDDIELYISLGATGWTVVNIIALLWLICVPEVHPSSLRNYQTSIYKRRVSAITIIHPNLPLTQLQGFVKYILVHVNCINSKLSKLIRNTPGKRLFILLKKQIHEKGLYTKTHRVLQTVLNHVKLIFMSVTNSLRISYPILSEYVLLTQKN